MEFQICLIKLCLSINLVTVNNLGKKHRDNVWWHWIGENKWWKAVVTFTLFIYLHWDYQCMWQFPNHKMYKPLFFILFYFIYLYIYFIYFLWFIYFICFCGGGGGGGGGGGWGVGGWGGGGWGGGGVGGGADDVVKRIWSRPISLKNPLRYKGMNSDRTLTVDIVKRMFRIELVIFGFHWRLCLCIHHWFTKMIDAE